MALDIAFLVQVVILKGRHYRNLRTSHQVKTTVTLHAVAQTQEEAESLPLSIRNMPDPTYAAWLLRY